MTPKRCYCDKFTFTSNLARWNWKSKLMAVLFLSGISNRLKWFCGNMPMQPDEAVSVHLWEFLRRWHAITLTICDCQRSSQRYITSSSHVADALGCLSSNSDTSDSVFTQGYCAICCFPLFHIVQGRFTSIRLFSSSFSCPSNCTDVSTPLSTSGPYVFAGCD